MFGIKVNTKSNAVKVLLCKSQTKAFSNNSGAGTHLGTHAVHVMKSQFQVNVVFFSISARHVV